MAWLHAVLIAALVAAAPAPAARYRVVGQVKVDTRAPGAPVLLRALSFKDPLPVLGIFDTDRREVVNAFVHTVEVRGHSDALPPGMAHPGGYTLLVDQDGLRGIRGSGSVRADITPAVERAVLRHFGITPADESWPARVRRALLDAWDAADRFLRRLSS